MSRQETLYQLYYSYISNRIYSTLMNRLDKCMTFALLLLGSSVMASAGNAVIIGFCIAIIAALQNSFKPSSTFEVTRLQSSRYLNLFTASEETSDPDLTAQILNTQLDDISIWSSIESIAEYRTDIALKEKSQIKLTYFEKLLCWVC